MGRALFQMLYRKSEHEVILNEPERFDITHFASIVLLIAVIVVAVVSPEILREHILSISKDFGIKL